MYGMNGIADQVLCVFIALCGAVDSFAKEVRIVSQLRVVRNSCVNVFLRYQQLRKYYFFKRDPVGQVVDLIVT